MNPASNRNLNTQYVFLETLFRGTLFGFKRARGSLGGTGGLRQPEDLSGTASRPHACQTKQNPT